MPEIEGEIVATEAAVNKLDSAKPVANQTNSLSDNRVTENSTANRVISSTKPQEMTESPIKEEESANKLVEGEDGGLTPEPKYNHKLSFVFATIASIFFGMADYLIALLSIKNGMKWMYPTFIITTIVWTIFHIGRWVILNKKRRAENL